MIKKDYLKGLCWLQCDRCKRALGPKERSTEEAVKAANEAGFRFVSQRFNDLAVPGSPIVTRKRWLCAACTQEAEKSAAYYARKLQEEARDE